MFAVWAEGVVESERWCECECEGEGVCGVPVYVLRRSEEGSVAFGLDSVGLVRDEGRMPLNMMVSLEHDSRQQTATGAGWGRERDWQEQVQERQERQEQ
jgi:hypothetical protein